ncbi:MAG: hypothetical protein KAR42_09815 [candidate division Zixibacteria bacterium]|nr:hypothetical protein [candidate division Zixibacteria bacterium]
MAVKKHSRKKKYAQRSFNIGNKLPTAISVILLTAGIAAFLYLSFQYDFTQDDTYISLRYALNYLNGDGLVYNIGERIEGYTNFLWVLFLVIGGIFKLELVTLARILGIIFGCGTLLMTYLLALRLGESLSDSNRKIIAGASSLIVGAAYSYAYWSVSGMETACFTFLTTASIYCYVTKSRLLPVALVLATLTRPEGALVCAIIIIYEILSTRTLSAYIRSTVILYTVALLPFAAFKLMYYGYLLPNTFYAKTSFSFEQLKNGFFYTGLYFWHYLGAGLFILPCIIFYKKMNKSIRAVILFFLVYSLYITIIGGDVLKVHRFFIPLMPIAAIIAMLGLFRLWPRKIMIIISLVVILGWQYYMPREHVNTFYQKEQGLLSKMSIMIDQLLKIDKTNFSLAASTIGIVGYKLIGHPVIDMLGLTDSTIARHPEKQIPGITSTWRESRVNSVYLLSRQPDYILFSTGIKPSAPAERSLFLHTAFWDSYRTIPFRGRRSLYSMYKKYHEVPKNIQRNIPAEFVQNFTTGVNQLWREKDFPASLTSFNAAQSYFPGQNNPYVYYYKGLLYLYMRNLDSCLYVLETLVAEDTLTYEGYKNLYMYKYDMGEYDTAMYYRRKMAQLTPWYMPHMDSVVRGQL